jgi:hypothetical protein
MSSFKHSYINFRNKGEVQASLIFTAHGELRIPYMEEVLLGKFLSSVSPRRRLNRSCLADPCCATQGLRPSELASRSQELLPLDQSSSLLLRSKERLPLTRKSKPSVPEWGVVGVAADSVFFPGMPESTSRSPAGTTRSGILPRARNTSTRRKTTPTIRHSPPRISRPPGLSTSTGR